jgi:hypothetical protein
MFFQKIAHIFVIFIAGVLGIKNGHRFSNPIMLVAVAVVPQFDL